MRPGAILKWILMGIFLTLIVVVLVIGGILFWYFHRPLPAPIHNQHLFAGITYNRIIETQSSYQIVHIIEIDLNTDGLSFLVTPSGTLENYDFEALTTSQFLDTFDLQLAMNGDFFEPWKDYGPFNYYPHTGDGASTRGLSASQGEVTTIGYVPPPYYATLYLSRDNRASFTAPDGEIFNAISGNMWLIRDGQIPQFRDDPYLQKRHPRTAIGLTRDKNTLILVIVDGRQPNYSDGATLAELAQILVDAGAYNAINMDGGGSSTLVMDDNSTPKILNSPIQSHIPARERPVANHLGIYARPMSQ